MPGAATIAAPDRPAALELPPDAPLLRNLPALWVLDPALARRLEEPDRSLTCPPDRADAPPVDLTAVDPLEQFAFAIFGFGPHLLDLFALCGGAEGEAVFLVFEPDHERLWAQLCAADYTELLASRRLVVFDKVDGAAFADRVAPLAGLISLGIGVVSDGAALQGSPEFFAAAAGMLEQYRQSQQIHLNTALQFGRKTCFNIAANLPRYAENEGLSRLAGVFAGRPAILVSAGPSLRKNIDRLREAAGRAVIIAVQTTLQPLLEAGIVPHFVTALDHHRISTRFYERLPESLPTELVAEPKTSPEVIEAWMSRPGRKLTLLGNDFAESLLREMRPNLPTLPAGATVAHLAFLLAEHLGCSEAILVGQDLGFSDGLAYVPGTSYDDVWRAETGRFCTFEMRQWEHIARDRGALVRLTDYEGRTVYSEQRLLAYLRQFEQLFARTRLAVIDATEGGVAKAGVRPMPLAEAMERYCTEQVPETPPTSGPVAGEAAARLEAARRCLDARRAEAQVVLDVSRRTLPLLEQIHAYQPDGARVNRLLGEVDGLHRQLRPVDETYRLIARLSLRSEQERFRADLRIRAAGLAAIERQRRQTERDIENVRAIGSAAADFIGLVDETRRRMAEG